MSLLRRLREPANQADRQESESGDSPIVPGLQIHSAGNATFSLPPGTVANTPRWLPKRLYKMTLEFHDWRVVAYREELTGMYFLPVNSCGRLIKYELLRLMPEYDFVITTTRLADGENRVVINSDYTGELTEAMEEICDLYCGMPVNRDTDVVTIKPPYNYKGAPCLFMCSSIEWKALK
jgi:hypothetical protein